jgi:pilus assembly protein Flp/PilA
MNAINTFFARLMTGTLVSLEREEGQSLVEWALILALVAVVAVTILGTIGTNVVTKLTSIANAL